MDFRNGEKILMHKIYIYCLCLLSFNLCAQVEITEGDEEQIKEMSKFLVESLEASIKVIGDKNTTSSVRNLMKKKTIEKLFYDESVYIEDDLLPAREEDRNVAPNVYFTNVHLFFGEDGVVIDFDNIQVSDIFYEDYLFTIVDFDRKLEGESVYLNMQLTNNYERQAEIRCEQVNGEWSFKIMSIRFKEEGVYQKVKVKRSEPVAKEIVQKDNKKIKVDSKSKQQGKKAGKSSKKTTKPEKPIVKEEPKEEKEVILVSKVKDKFPNAWGIEYKRLEKQSKNSTDKQNLYKKTDIATLKKVHKIYGGPENAALSIFVPGWGKSKVTGKNQAFTTLVAYGALGSSIYTKIQSNKRYDEYLAETDDLNGRADLYNKANLMNKISIVTGSIAALVWVYDISTTLARGSKNNRQINALKKDYNLVNTNFQLQPLPNGQLVPSIGLTLKF